MKLPTNKDIEDFICQKTIMEMGVSIKPYILKHRIKAAKMIVKLIKEVGCYGNLDVIQSQTLFCAPHSLVLKAVLQKPAILDEHNCETILRYRIDGTENMSWKKLLLFEKISCRNFRK